MKINCKCGEVVCEGEIGNDKKGRKIFKMKDKPKGTIIKNKSKNPNDWVGICSECQESKN